LNDGYKEFTLQKQANIGIIQPDFAIFNRELANISSTWSYTVARKSLFHELHDEFCSIKEFQIKAQELI